MIEHWHFKIDNVIYFQGRLDEVEKETSVAVSTKKHTINTLNYIWNQQIFTDRQVALEGTE